MLNTHMGLRLLSRLLMLLVLLAAARQADCFDVFWTGGTGSWTDGGNWDSLAEPDSFFEDVAVINNGGTATLNTTAIGVAGMALGYEAGGSGTVIIQNGGSLTLIETEGAATAIDPNGAANVGFEGGNGSEGDSGLLEVQGGGFLEVVYFDINQHGTLRIGTGTGSATVTTSTGSLFSNGSVEVVGPGHSITLAGNLAFESKAEGSSRFIPRITHPTDHSVITATGTATLTGSLAPRFDGVTPQIGDSWDLIDATTVTGQFAVDLSGAPLPAAGTTFVSRVVSGGNGQIVQLALENRAAITVNGDTGAVSISSPSGAAVDMVGYSILSGSGQLNAGAWNSLANQAVPGWQEAGGAATHLNELNPENSLALSATPNGIGSVYQAPSAFGVSPDLTFQYAEDGELTPTNGIVYYEGHKWANNLLLTVNPSTGEGQLKNSSNFTIDVLGYTITSEEGSLDDTNWMSLESQSVSGWDEAASNGFSLNELVPEGPASVLSPGQSYSLGDMFTVGGLRDLALEFAVVLDGIPQVMQGVVTYGDISVLVGLPGDFNNDNVVDAADYTVWRDNLGLSDAALGGNGTGHASGLVVQADYLLWRDNYGSTGAGAGALAADLTAAPEPCSLLTLFAALLTLCGIRRGRDLRFAEFATCNLR